jgi:hypothetical protein
MTEDELLTAIGDALSLTGRRWMHIRRSDQAVSMGTRGFPDVVAVVGDTLLLWELKGETGVRTPEQVWWANGLQGCRRVQYRLVRPDDLDSVLGILLAGRGALT